MKRPGLAELCDRLVACGFTAVLPPVLVREEAMYGTGFFPSEKHDFYEIPADGLYLVGTSEVPLAAYHMNEIITDLPRRYVAWSNSCWRGWSFRSGITCRMPRQRSTFRHFG